MSAHTPPSVAPRGTLAWAGLSLAVLAWNTRAIDHFHLVTVSVTTAVIGAAACVMLLAWALLSSKRSEANWTSAAVALGISATGWLQFQPLPALPPLLRTALLVLTLFAPVLLIKLTRDTRLLERLAVALFTFALLFTLSGTTLAWQRSSSITWPQDQLSPLTTVGESSNSPTVDRVFLLLDESNADIFGPLIAFAKDQQLPTAEAATIPLGRNTAEVVPQWFSNHRRTNWRPCTATAACASDVAVDFARIHASHPNIDVVGFYFPYCAIAGLRSCEAPWTSWATTFDGRVCDWSASPLLRRFISSARCIEDAALEKQRLTTRLLDAYWHLPFWQQGGMVLAHLPIPHPPTLQKLASLAEHYRSGASQANEVAIETLKRLVARGRPFELVVFSDHPLRTATWCKRYWPDDQSCIADAPRTEAIPRITITDREHVPRQLDASSLTPFQ